MLGIVFDNIVINTAGVATLACTLGGNYDFKHCTFNNNWGSSKQTAVLIDNYYTDGTTNQQVPFDLTKASFSNCIIYGSNSYELTINKATDTSNNFYDNSYKFTKEISEILGRIEAGFGEKLKHIDVEKSRYEI